MWTVQLVNESDQVRYDSQQDLQNLLVYVCQTQKTYVDSIRYNPTFKGPYIGCKPSPFSGKLLLDADVALQQMNWNHLSYPKKTGNLAKHRIISFDPNSMVIPQELDSLGQQVISLYANNGYIALYAVHADTVNPHLHIVVDAISFDRGRCFDMSFELGVLQSIIRRWWNQYETQKLSSERAQQAKEDLLFGKLRYGSIPLSCADQIKTNKAMHY